MDVESANTVLEFANSYSVFLRELSVFLPNLSDLISRPFYREPEVIAVVVSSLVALAIALFGEHFRRLTMRGKLKVVGTKVYDQSTETYPPFPPEVNKLHLGRIAIKNEGYFKALSVEAYVEAIKYTDNDRENFLAVPLSWTHGQLLRGGIITRDIHPKQIVYLDIFNYFFDNDYVGNHVCRLATPVAQNVDILTGIGIGKSELVIKVYQERGKHLTVNLIVEWINYDRVPSVRLKNKIVPF